MEAEMMKFYHNHSCVSTVVKEWRLVPHLGAGGQNCQWYQNVKLIRSEHCFTSVWCVVGSLQYHALLSHSVWSAQLQDSMGQGLRMESW